MRIVVDYKIPERENTPLKIVAAKYLSDYVIRMNFTNGEEKLVDFKSFLQKSVHPSIKKYLNEHYFSDFKLKDGNLNWNDYELIFPVEDLYTNSICKAVTNKGV